ncbi:hypothetical protein N3K66_000073 [Trichothecium roseum]|uniref:Uncharacterized protein n=1 Tax=Trichothecium roseum TaxID=47278 RepID=A0ACC0VB71_9HYPO|nr:hypothetical protein N3K66_000073 [Trichothecium roseum]
MSEHYIQNTQAQQAEHAEATSEHHDHDQVHGHALSYVGSHVPLPVDSYPADLDEDDGLNQEQQAWLQQQQQQHYQACQQQQQARESAPPFADVHTQQSHAAAAHEYQQQSQHAHYQNAPAASQGHWPMQPQDSMGNYDQAQGTDNYADVAGADQWSTCNASNGDQSAHHHMYNQGWDVQYSS